jgi:transcription termination factor Rho
MEIDLDVEQPESAVRAEPGDDSRTVRPVRAERLERPERAERIERGERIERADRAERPERGERFERAERPERFERAERPERGERAERPERPERGERVERGNGERPERAERYDRDRDRDRDRGDRGGRFERGRGRGDRQQRVYQMRTYQERVEPQPKTFKTKDGEEMNLLSVKELEDKTRNELVELARKLEIPDLQRIKKQDLVFPILEAQAKAAGLSFAIGVLDMLPEGYGFLRRENMRPGPHDVYISQSQIRRFELRSGDLVAGQIRDPKDNEKYHGILKVDAVNGQDPEGIRGRPHFDKLVPIYPDQRLKMETSSLEMCGRVLDLLCPIGKGQRGLIVSPPKAGKTTLLKKIANAIAANHPEVDLFALLVDERPEEVTDMRRSIEGDVISSTFDEHPDNHTAVSELTLERCKRLVELGHDVVILLDSITRLARAWNQVMPATGRTLSGGLDTSALHKPKRFFGAARNIEGGGSLTIIATALIETGSKMDDVIFEEFKGTGNMEINLVRKLADSRIFPAVDIKRSGTRHEELLLSEVELRKIVMLRRATAVLGVQEMTELILERFRRTDSNEDFLKSVTKEAMSMASDGDR